MNISNRKRIIASILGVGQSRIWIDPNRLGDIKQAITKEDMRGLINDGAIMLKPKVGVSKVRHRKKLIQKRKGRRKGLGSRKGKRTSRLPRKKEWVMKVRLQRNLITDFKKRGVITGDVYSNLRKRVKGGFFRSIRHIKLYLGERGLIKNGKK